MHRLPFRTPPQWWPSSMNPTLVRLLAPFRRRRLRGLMRIAEVEVQGEERVKSLLAENAAVLIAPNHPGDGDVDSLCEVADRVGRPFHFMAAWQVFLENGRVGRWLMQRMGAFSVDREGSDMRAFRHAVEILQTHSCPLVIFPEGECYYVNDRVMPFLEGPAAIASAAARKAERKVAIVPCGIKLFYVTDPLPGIREAMDRLEAAIYWRQRRDNVPLVERIYRFAEGPLALKELEYLGHTQAGPLGERLRRLTDEILTRIEKRHAIASASEQLIPARLKKARQKAIEAKEAATTDEARRPFEDDLDDLFLAAQVYSYPGDYVRQQPTVERIADTIKKFEEDILRTSRPRPHGERKAVIVFGEPIVVESERKKGATAELTARLETTVQTLLDGIPRPAKTFEVN